MPEIPGATGIAVELRGGSISLFPIESGHTVFVPHPRHPRAAPAEGGRGPASQRDRERSFVPRQLFKPSSDTPASLFRRSKSVRVPAPPGLGMPGLPETLPGMQERSGDGRGRAVALRHRGSAASSSSSSSSSSSLSSSASSSLS